MTVKCCCGATTEHILKDTNERQPLTCSDCRKTSYVTLVKTWEDEALVEEEKV